MHCKVQQIANVTTKSLSLLDPDVSGPINLTLALVPGGYMMRFLTQFDNGVGQGIVILRAHPPQGSHELRDWVLKSSARWVARSRYRSSWCGFLPTVTGGGEIGWKYECYLVWTQRSQEQWAKTNCFSITSEDDDDATFDADFSDFGDRYGSWRKLIILRILA